MKWTPENQTVELTERNVAALTTKLDDPLSVRTLVSPCGLIAVQAVEVDRSAPPSAGLGGPMRGVVQTLVLTRAALRTLAVVGSEVMIDQVRAVSVADAEHYIDRAPGPVFMPSTGETS